MWKLPFCGGPILVGGGGGAVRGIVFVGALLGGFGLGVRGDDGCFFSDDKLLADPDWVMFRSGGGGGGPLLPKRFGPDEVFEFENFRPPWKGAGELVCSEGGAGGVVRSGGGGGPGRLEGGPPLKDVPILTGGGGGAFPPEGLGGPARAGGGGGGLLALLTPGPPPGGPGNLGGPGREKLLGGLGPFADGGEVGLLAGGRLTPLLKPESENKRKIRANFHFQFRRHTWTGG